MKSVAIRPKPPGSDNRGALRPAAKKAVQKRIYHCGVCLAGFPRHLATKRHEEQCAARLRRLFICCHCLTLYGDEARLERHRQRKHTDGQFLCLQCAKRYKSATFLYRHVVSWHGEQSLFYCAMCADNCSDVKTFSGMRELQEHADEVHHLRFLESTASETARSTKPRTWRCWRRISRICCPALTGTTTSPSAGPWAWTRSRALWMRRSRTSLCVPSAPTGFRAACAWCGTWRGFTRRVRWTAATATRAMAAGMPCGPTCNVSTCCCAPMCAAFARRTSPPPIT
ncbi:uncharacterized protein LOC108136459 isoform X2 [Drosophila elegans]|uniref:uncharacterized protein LOC108136459 isoform X2 n=1 Tax=Drosophila elegans TaxID=30023 RepID=UPI0007E8084B|nr:uncharacterized protein LOC108136459 isoform X2 [Drosophila elegans]